MTDINEQLEDVVKRLKNINHGITEFNLKNFVLYMMVLDVIYFKYESVSEQIEEVFKEAGITDRDVIMDILYTFSNPWNESIEDIKELRWFIENEYFEEDDE